MSGWMLFGIALVMACLLTAPVSWAVPEQAQAKSVTLIKGLDGGTYERYSSAVIEKVQAALKTNGLYQGEVNGELDEATMKAIGELQEANNLTVSGVPTPATRRLFLEE